MQDKAPLTGLLTSFRKNKATEQCAEADIQGSGNLETCLCMGGVCSERTYVVGVHDADDMLELLGVSPAVVEPGEMLWLF